MNNAFFMAIGAGVANAGVALAGKAAQHSRCRAVSYSFVVFAVAAITAFLATLGGEAAWGDWRLWCFGGSMGAMYLVAIAAMLHANRCWAPSVVWSAANMAFVVPILLSALVLDEKLRWVDALIVAGVVFMLVGLIERNVSSSGSAIDDALRRSAPKRWLLLGIVFASNGVLMLGYKLFAVVLPGQRTACLVTVIYGCGAALAGAVLAGRGMLRVNRFEAGWGLAAGTASGLSALAVLMAMQLPAAVAFPVIQGTSLVGGVLLCAAFFRERLTLRKVAALVVGLGTMALTLLR